MSNIIGGTPTGDGDALIDTTGAVLLDDIEVVLMGAKHDNDVEAVICLELAGRINKTSNRDQKLYILGADHAAAICANLVVHASHVGGGYSEAFVTRLEEHMAWIEDDYKHNRRGGGHA